MRWTSEARSFLSIKSSMTFELYKQIEFGEIKFGEAQVLATAKNVSLTKLKERGIIESGRGLVRLLRREELIGNPDGSIWVLTQRAVHYNLTEGFEAAAKKMSDRSDSEMQLVKQMSYRLYDISDKRKSTEEAAGYSQAVENWDDFIEYFQKYKSQREKEQQTLDWGGDYNADN